MLTPFSVSSKFFSHRENLSEHTSFIESVDLHVSTHLMVKDTTKDVKQTSCTANSCLVASSTIAFLKPKYEYSGGTASYFDLLVQHN